MQFNDVSVVHRVLGANLLAVINVYAPDTRKSQSAGNVFVN